ncbi:MAG TPA: four-carbon acid sugar kinase family protein [Niabella sp.]|nr:four-carbon acid sugar kinase family protein [Niabella sp.]
MPVNNNLLLAFYGDDFTGSTDALEFICKAGAKAVLFIEPPDAAVLNKFPVLDVIGIAGKTRALPADEMEQVLNEAFQKMKVYNARHIHYKVCSTFDSSPQTGSIGRVLDTGAAVFQNRPVPILGGTPSLGRYCVFGNLFAKMGIGSNGAVYRLDRHPSMSNHPVTPADESDLRLHLQKQTCKKLALMDILQLRKPVNEWNNGIDAEEAVLLDAIDEEQLVKIGEWLDTEALKKGASFFSIGSSAIEMALGNYWNRTGQLDAATNWNPPGKAESLLVVSGSCSPVTAAQITWAKANGFEEVILDAISVGNDATFENSVAVANDYLRLQKNVIVHTGDKKETNLPSEKLGTALGEIARRMAEQHTLKRVVIAGGDTSSYAARAMEIDAVEMMAPLVSGAPLCKALSKNKAIDGLEVNFKGGQVGSENYFGILRNGRVGNNE